MTWAQRIGLGLSALVTLFFVVDAAGKLLRVQPVLKGTADLGWPPASVVPLGILLLIGAALHAVPRTSFLGAVWLTGFLGGAVAAHLRIGSPLATHVLFGVYVGALMWGGLALRYPHVFVAALRPSGQG
jgi:hypothetical protein